MGGGTVTSRIMDGGGPDQSPFDADTFFDDILGNPWDERRRLRRDPDADPFALLGRLQLLLTTLSNPAAAAHGDAVFSQEALDRVITQLMEASPQTNAAPPASQAAMKRLQRKWVDDEMLGPEGKAECTICIDEINKGDQVLVLPCKHWYHGGCVTLWLKEHNTCPICRMPIESPEDESPEGGSPPPVSPGPSLSSASTRPTSERVGSSNRFRTARENMDRLDSIRNLATGVEQPSSSSSQRQDSQSPPGVWPLPSESAEMARAMTRSRSASRERDANGAGDGAGHDTTGRAPPVRMTSAMAQGVVSWGGGRQLSQSQQQSPPPQQHPPPPQYHTRPQSTPAGDGLIGWLRDHFGRRSD